MASNEAVSGLVNIALEYDNIRTSDLLRRNLGDASLAIFEPTYTEIISKLEFARRWAPFVASSFVSNVTSSFQSIYALLHAQAQRSNGEFINNRDAFTQQVQQQLENLQNWWPAFITIAMEKQGFTTGFENALLEVKRESAELLSSMKKEGEKVIKEAEELARSIEARARLTASGISVKDAQTQFADARLDLQKKIKTWGWLAAASFVLFIVIAIALLGFSHPDDGWKWKLVYYTAIRITILTALAAVTGFCFKMLRANLHMNEYNLHRQRVANSISSFVEAASQEQRDVILGKLVDSVIAFGNSGILDKEEDAFYAPKMTIDAIMKSVSGGK